LRNARLVNTPSAKLFAYTEILRNGRDRLSRPRKRQGTLPWNEESACKPIGLVFESLIPIPTSTVISDRGGRMFEQAMCYFMHDVICLTRQCVTFVVNDVPVSANEYCYG